MAFNGWRQVRLADVAELTVGHVGSMAQEYVSSGVPFLRSLNVEPYRINADDMAFISHQFHAKLQKSSLRPGDLVIVRTGKPGACAVIPDWLSEANCSDVVIVRPGPEVDRHFLMYYINSVSNRHVSAHLVGAVQQHFNVGSAKQIPISLPPLDEQRCISRTLGALDDKIDLNRQMNAALEQIARTLFQVWFVDFLPVRAKAAARAEGRDPQRAAICALSGKNEAALDAMPREQYEQLAATGGLFPDELDAGEAGQIPQGWKVSTLGALVERHGGIIQTGPFGSQLHASDYADEGVPVVMPQDIAGRRVVTDKIARVRPENAERLARHRLEPGDIVFSRRGDVEKHALISEREQGWLCGTGCLLVRPGPRWSSPEYISQALTTTACRAWLRNHAVGATMPNLNTTILSALPILVPNDPVILAFHTIASGLDAFVNRNNAQSEILADLRDLLLPRLISGALAVAPADVAG